MLSNIIRFLRVQSRKREVIRLRSRSIILSAMSEMELEFAIFGDNIVWVK